MSSKNQAETKTNTAANTTTEIKSTKTMALILAILFLSPLYVALFYFEIFDSRIPIFLKTILVLVSFWAFIKFPSSMRFNFGLASGLLWALWAILLFMFATNESGSMPDILWIGIGICGIIYGCIFWIGGFLDYFVARLIFGFVLGAMRFFESEMFGAIGNNGWINAFNLAADKYGLQFDWLDLYTLLNGTYFGTTELNLLAVLCGVYMLTKIDFQERIWPLWAICSIVALFLGYYIKFSFLFSV